MARDAHPLDIPMLHGMIYLEERTTPDRSLDEAARQMLPIFARQMLPANERISSDIPLWLRKAIGVNEHDLNTVLARATPEGASKRLRSFIEVVVIKSTAVFVEADAEERSSI